MHDPAAASIAFFALGANLLGLLLLLLFNPRHRELRWYSAFVFLICVWLFSQAMAFTVGSWRIWGWTHGAAITLMPAFFLATSLTDVKRPHWHAWVAVALGFLMLPVMLQMIRSDGARAWSILMTAWHILGWGGGSYVMSTSSWREGVRNSNPLRSERMTMIALLVGAPLCVVIGILFGSEGFFEYAMPLITVMIQLLIFFGVARMRFYDIDVRVARTGEVAAQAAQSERLAVLGELAATVAHEVRNPLTGVRSLAQRIAEEDVGLEKRQRYAEVILEEVGRLDRIVDNLIGLSRRMTRTSWDGVAVPLTPLFEDLALLISAPARTAQVTVSAHASDLEADAPREAMAQALLNLLLNAIRHAPVNTTVSLTAHETENGIELRVRDAGPGVPAADRERIFRPFESTGNGTGLGLSVVRTLARELGWQLRVGDAPAGGAEFVIVIPAHAAARR
ncbi:MAG: HAMP domain-containing sensor histidine kinase [Gemmatimonadota bacterium]